MEPTEKIRSLIEASDKSITQIAKESGVPIPSISRFMRKERGLSDTSINKLAAYFDLAMVERRYLPK